MNGFQAPLRKCRRRPDGKREIAAWGAQYAGEPWRPLKPAPGDGLRVCQRGKLSPGYALYSPDHSNKFLLIDMDGRIVHEWQVNTSHFGYLLPNGHLLYDSEFDPDGPIGVHEVDWNGKPVWFHECQVHHDFQRLENGNTMILCQREMECAAIVPDGKILSSYLIEVEPSGAVVWEWYSEEHLEELARLAGVTFPRSNRDWTHSNTVQVLPETPSSRDPRFKPGNVIVSHRNLDAAIVIERETGRIVWAWGPGTLEYQHATVFLPNGHMICFDNGSRRKWSAIWEVDPIAREIVWSFKGDPPESFFGTALSNAQRLPNGNTFICSGSGTDFGRLLEVTPAGEIVWDYQNPYADYAEGERIVYRAYKYPPETIEPLLKR